MDTAAGMGAAVIFVLTISSFCTSLIYKFVLVTTGMEYMQTIVFILVIAALGTVGCDVPEKDDAGTVQESGCVIFSDHHQLCSTWCGTVKCTE